MEGGHLGRKKNIKKFFFVFVYEQTILLQRNEKNVDELCNSVISFWVCE